MVADRISKEIFKNVNVLASKLNELACEVDAIVKLWDEVPIAPSDFRFAISITEKLSG